MDYIRGWVEKINFGGFSELVRGLTGPEMLFVGLILVFLLLYGLSLGRTRALVSLLGIYIAFVFNSTFIYFGQLYEWIPIQDTQLIRIGLFLLVYFLVFAILNKSLVKTRLTLREASFFSVFLISILQLGLLISIITNLLSDNYLVYLPPIFLTYFGSGLALFYWSIAPIVILLFMRRQE
jgi:hypothetical protein